MLATPFFLSALLALASVSSATPVPGGSPNTKKCPPADFDAVTEFSLDAYLGQWYIQAQAPTQYLPVEQNFCTSARYRKTSNNTISIFNFSRASRARTRSWVGSITGPIEATIPNIRGTIRDPSRPSKIYVGPVSLPESLAGPYFVVATSPIVDGQYQWSVVSGGPPLQESNGKCLANKTSAAPLERLNGNGQGLWIFTRAQVADPAMVKKLKAVADSLGLDASAMNDVQHAGCTYN
ncbi:hypothetical protein HDU96_001606 [Phlyctochytrium bullatum]|nr:hypothetical protein HDU96_001606 [Phlyctochytrium bullatum]